MAAKRTSSKSPRPAPVAPAKAKVFGGPIVNRGSVKAASPKSGKTPAVKNVIGGPIVSRVFGGPIVSRVFGGPIVSRVFGGPIVNREAAPAPMQFWGGPTIERDIASREPSPDPAGQPLKVLCVHGVGDHHTNLAWAEDWRTAIQNAVATWNVNRTVTCEFLMYDDLFDGASLNAGTYTEALFKLGGSGLVAAGEAVADKVGQAFNDVSAGIGSLFHPSRGLSDIPAELRWTAGMVAQWANDDNLRDIACARVEEMIAAVEPDLILAHSLGTLVCYDAFSRNQRLLAGRDFVVFGSQIGNPFVRGTFGGYIGALTRPKRWFQLFNPNDRAFSAPIQPPPSPSKVDPTEDVFNRVMTPFNDGFLSHDAVRYLTHPNASDTVWREIVTRNDRVREFRTIQKSFSIGREIAKKAKRRALLVGINDYPDPANQLEGCLNDVFRVSATLQERGFKPEEIRVVFNDRATATGIMDRLHWLLDGTCPGDERVFYFSGHGAQIPMFDPNGMVDHQAESLVPYDFDWSPEKAITDQKFSELYSQLPFDSQLLTALDCCHAGGLGTGNASQPAAAGNGAGPSKTFGVAGSAGLKVRGLAPPDDIRHRSIEWNEKIKMWVQRKLKPATHEKRIMKPDRKTAYVGASGSVHRFGRAIGLRRLNDDEKKQHRRRTRQGHAPFVPVVMQACQEEELAYEYRDGFASYGAFTFALTQVLRDTRKTLNFEQLTTEVKRRLHRHLKLNQTPCLFGAKTAVKRTIPT